MHSARVREELVNLNVSFCSLFSIFIRLTNDHIVCTLHETVGDNDYEQLEKLPCLPKQQWPQGR